MDKSLEALERMKENSDYVDDKNLKEDFKISEKELKALKIIKKCGIKVEKREDFDVIGYATFRKNGKYRYYINDIEITQEEHDILKEALGNE